MVTTATRIASGDLDARVGGTDVHTGLGRLHHAIESGAQQMTTAIRGYGHEERMVVAATDASWKGLVIDAAPLNPECEKSSSSAKSCNSRITDEPSGWKRPAFDDGSWQNATVYSEEAVGVKQGYLVIKWDASAKLIWSKDLKVDNTILWRKTVPPLRDGYRPSK